jgi:hypothetical protein
MILFQKTFGIFLGFVEDMYKTFKQSIEMQPQMFCELKDAANHLFRRHQWVSTPSTPDIKHLGLPFKYILNLV